MAVSVNIKMYRVGELGDCFLLTFNNDTVKKHMLIDCGSFRNSDTSMNRLQEVVENIKDKQLKGAKLDVVVGTHQHNDHVSGFVHAKHIFDQIGVNKVWLSWLDNPKSKQAVRIGESHLELRKSLTLAASKLENLSSAKSGRKMNTRFAKKAVETKNLITELMGFHGAAPELPAKGIEYLKKFGEVEYLSPGEIKNIPGLSGVRVFVLGPPKDEELLYRKNPRKGESYDHKLRAFNAMSNHFIGALTNRNGKRESEEQQFPFNMDYKRYVDKPGSFSPSLKSVAAEYNAKGNEWRNIDDDWLDQAARLSLYMDTFTNNSSLVLAIEIVSSGKVLLFAADAQTGNWISWNDLEFKTSGTSVDNLLSRTVFYKVGHHGSHNSTLKASLEKMISDELVAMIPVQKTDPNITKEDGWKMPAANLYQRLKEKTGYRVLRMDDGFADECNPKKSKKAKSSWGKVGLPKVTPLYVEYSIS